MLKIGSSLQRWCDYLRCRWSYPGYAIFINEGLGIEARYERCRQWWAPHLELSRGFLNDAFFEYGPVRAGSPSSPVPGSDTSPSSPSVSRKQKPKVQILGSGRCLDIDLQQLMQCSQELVLVDADPSAELYLRRHSLCRHLLSQQSRPDFAEQQSSGSLAQVQCEVADVTGGFDLWESILTKSAQGAKQSGVAMPKFVTTLLPEVLFPPLVAPARTAEIIISLNLLSQIPLLWKLRVIAILEATFKTRMQGDAGLIDQLWYSLAQSRQLLEEQHLALLANSGAERIILLADRLWHFYETKSGAWESEPALVAPLPESLPNYYRARYDSWWWHVAPQGVEHTEYGSIHDVVAIEFMVKKTLRSFIYDKNQ